ncbi:hypothetical protein TWF569_000160 [Orbilia oligospora]|nr:hypothetical protein TWF569_000160 [Orbilia oligospora]
MPPSEPPSLPQKQPILQDAPMDDSKLKKGHKPDPVNPPRPPLISGQPIPSGDSLLWQVLSASYFFSSPALAPAQKSDHMDSIETFSAPSQTISQEQSTTWIRAQRYHPILLSQSETFFLQYLIYCWNRFMATFSSSNFIAKGVAKMLKHKRNNGASIDFDPFEIGGGLFEYAESPDHFTNLTKCTDELALQFNLPMDMVAAEMSKPEDEASEANEQFWMAIAMSYHKALSAAVCSECMSTVAEKPKTGADRICCHCDTDVKDIEVSKPPSRRPKPQVPPSSPSVASSPSPTRESKLRRGSGSSG